MTNALIVYTSLTGNTEACADIVAEQLESHDVHVEMLHAYDAVPEEFQDFDICLVGCYAYGDHGVLPNEIEEFYLALEEHDLSNKVYGVFGSGDDFYPLFCGQVDDFEEKFELTGATKGADGVKVNLYPEDEDHERLVAFADQIVRTYQNLIEN